MKKVILPLLVGFLLLVIMTFAAYAQTPSHFEVESYNVDKTIIYIRTLPTKFVKPISFVKDSVEVSADSSWTIYITPKTKISKEMIKQIVCYRLSDGSIFSVEKKYISSQTAKQILSLIKARENR